MEENTTEDNNVIELAGQGQQKNTSQFYTDLDDQVFEPAVEITSYGLIRQLEEDKKRKKSATLR